MKTTFNVSFGAVLRSCSPSVPTSPEAATRLCAIASRTTPRTRRASRRSPSATSACGARRCCTLRFRQRGRERRRSGEAPLPQARAHPRFETTQRREDQHLLHAREERADFTIGSVAPQRRAPGRERRVVEQPSEALADDDEALWALQVLTLQPVARLLSKGVLDELSGCAERGLGAVTPTSGRSRSARARRAATAPSAARSRTPR